MKDSAPGGFQQLSKAVLKVRVDDDAQTTRLETLSNQPLKLASKRDYIDEVTRLWQEAQSKFLAVGHYLVFAKETLPHGEFEQMVENELPFGPQIAYQLRTVAEAVIQERLGTGELPRSYSTAFLLASLPPEKLALARERRLVRPDVLRRDIQSFRTEVRTSTESNQERLLIAERRRLQRKIEECQTRLSEIARALGDRPPITIDGTTNKTEAHGD